MKSLHLHLIKKSFTFDLRSHFCSQVVEADSVPTFLIPDGPKGGPELGRFTKYRLQAGARGGQAGAPGTLHLHII